MRGEGEGALGTLARNSVTINGGKVDNGPVYGADAYTTGIATDNTVTINGGEVNSYHVCGAWVYGAATNNSVTINGGTVVGLVMGATGYGDATNNSVTINGGTVNGDIRGCYTPNGVPLVFFTRRHRGHGGEIPPCSPCLCVK